MGSADVDRYYVRLTEPEQLRKRGEAARALAAALELLQLVPALIEETTRLYGGFDLSSIPPIEEGCVLAAILQSSTALDTIESIVIERPELAPWREVVAKGRQDMATVAALEQHLASEPGSVQSDLGRTLVLDGHQVSRLVSYMDQAGRVRREVSGRSYTLYLVEEPAAG